jgi:hypothetical protein
MKAVEMTYAHLAMHASKKDWATERSPRVWSDLQSDVADFIKASTKTEKAGWFRKRGISDVNFLATITLPDGDEPLTRKLQFAQLSRPASHAPAALGSIPVPADVMSFVRDFWNAWVGTRDFFSLTSLYVAPDAVAKDLGVGGDPRVATAGALGIWRIRDHGLVERAGHVPPAAGTQAARDLVPALLDPAALVFFDGLQDAMLGLGQKGPPIAVAAAGSGRYAAFGRFRHLPHDVVMVTVEQVQGGWRVTSLRSVVEH